MVLLELLSACIEQGRTSIAPELVDVEEREQLAQLHRMGALVETQARAVICPRCEAHSVRMMAARTGFCLECGPVSLSPKDVLRLTPDGDWLRRRIAQALNLSAEQFWMMVTERVWRIGDISRSGTRHRVLYGQRLTDSMVQRVLLDMWPTHVGRTHSVVITTSPISRIFLPGVDAHFVPLQAAFRVRGTGLVADEAIWAGIAASDSRGGQSRVGPFGPDYRDILLPGESTPIPLTPAQSSLLRVLWERRGQRVHRDLLMSMSKLDLDKPVQAFPRPKYPEANRAYRLLVRANRQGQYWWATEDLEPSPDET